MRDFTLKAYANYLELIRKAGLDFYTFRDFMSEGFDKKSYCLIRHDVDRKPMNALNMARLEHKMGIVSTYYFRTKANTMKPKIIREIYDLGHEIGYHYESLSDTDGNISAAIIDFESNLKRLREIVPIDTCSMHGRPLKPHDNRDIWKIKENHDLLISKFNLLGEVYLDIDYNQIAYINDTGRNWTSGLSNRRDKVLSEISADFDSMQDLISYLGAKPHPKMVFQIHPERWSDDLFDWSVQYSKDLIINTIKWILQLVKY